VAQIELHPAAVVDLWRDRLGLLRVLRRRLSYFSKLCQASRSLLVRLTDGALRTRNQPLAFDYGITTSKNTDKI
jgi:hypothetical protein